MSHRIICPILILFFLPAVSFADLICRWPFDGDIFKDAPVGGIGRAESPLVIGAKIVDGKTEPSRYLDGAVDEIQIFDDALDSREIDELSDRDRYLRAKLTQMYEDYGITHNAVHRGAGKNRPENTLESFEAENQSEVTRNVELR